MGRVGDFTVFSSPAIIEVSSTESMRPADKTVVRMCRYVPNFQMPMTVIPRTLNVLQCFFSVVFRDQLSMKSVVV